MAAPSGANSSARHVQGAPVTDTPLLDGQPRSSDAAERDQESILRHATPLTSIVLFFMTIHFLLAFCEIVLVAPLLRLFENSLCLSHFGFPPGGVEEYLCKIPGVQGPLATIRGWKSMFDTIPGTWPPVPLEKLAS